VECTLGDSKIGKYSFDELGNWSPWKQNVTLVILAILLIGLLLGVWHKPSACCSEESSNRCPVGQQCSATTKPCTPKVTRVLTVGEASFFDFNKPTVRPEAVRILDRLIVARLQDLSVAEIKLVGHADPIRKETSDEYNIKLSKERARAVGEVITHLQTLPDGCNPVPVPMDNPNRDRPTIKVCIEGNGSADSDEYIKAICIKKTGESLKTCYQPLRRVDVEITGDVRTAQQN
jgi:hypothetical protein